MKTFLFLLYLTIRTVFCAASPPAALAVPAILPVAPLPVRNNWSFIAALSQYLMFANIAISASRKSRDAASALAYYYRPDLINETPIIISSICVALGIFFLSLVHGRFMSRSQILGASLSLGHFLLLMFWWYFDEPSVEALIRNLSINSEVIFYLPIAGLVLIIADRFSS